MLFDRMRTQRSYLLKACAIGSALAGLFLLLMPLVGHPLSSHSQMMIWSGTEIISHDQLLLYTSQFYRMFSLVSLYLIGHFLMWLGYSYIIFRKFPFIAGLILLIGTLSTFTDMTEYMMRIAMWNGVLESIHSSSTFMFFWWAIREFSIWVFYMGTVIIGIMFIGRTYLNITMSVLALVGLLTIPVMYVFHHSMIWFVWLILWHFASAFMIYKLNQDRDDELLIKE